MICKNIELLYLIENDKANVEKFNYIKNRFLIYLRL